MGEHGPRATDGPARHRCSREVVRAAASAALSSGIVASGVELDIDEFGPHFGAEIRGIDVAQATDDQVRAIRQALIEYKVIVLRDQNLDDASHIEFGNGWGS